MVRTHISIRDHEGKIYEMPINDALALDPFATVGWDYLDENGNWYALRALLPIRRRY